MARDTYIVSKYIRYMCLNHVTYLNWTPIYLSNVWFGVVSRLKTKTICEELKIMWIVAIALIWIL